MEPTLHRGDRVRVIRRPLEELHIGDIVAFTGFGQVLAHRVVARVNDYWVTCGDNNPIIDEEHLTASNYLGYVSLPETWAGNSTGLESQIPNSFLNSSETQFRLKVSLVAPRVSDLHEALVICHCLGIEAYGCTQSDADKLREHVIQSHTQRCGVIGISAQARTGANRLVEMYATYPHLHIIMGATYGPPEAEGFLLPWTQVQQLVRLQPIGMPALQLHVEVAYLLGILAGSKR